MENENEMIFFDDIDIMDLTDDIVINLLVYTY